METGVNWGDIATWVTGIATIALFIIGFIQIRNERISRIKAEKKIETRDKRDQAERISSWFVKATHDNHGDWQWIAILNQSAQPIYNVIVSIVPLSQKGDKLASPKPHRVCIDVVPPGQGYTSVDAIQFGHPGHSRAGVEIAFKDRSGSNWIRKATGELSEIDKSAMEYYNIDLPTSWVGLDTELPPDDMLGLYSLDNQRPNDALDR